MKFLENNSIEILWINRINQPCQKGKVSIFFWKYFNWNIVNKDHKSNSGMGGKGGTHKGTLAHTYTQLQTISNFSKIFT